MENNNEILKARFIKTIKIIDDKDHVELSIYRLSSGGYVALNSSYMKIMTECIPIHSPYDGNEAIIDVTFSNLYPLVRLETNENEKKRCT